MRVNELLIYAFLFTFIFMKRLFFILSILTAFRASAETFYCTPIQYQPSPWDDTATLSAACAAGNVTLTRNYSISGQINIIYQLHGAGYTINTSQTTGTALRVTSSGAQIDHVTIQGSWAYTGSPNPSGNSGIVINAGSNNVTIQYNHIENVSGYGINVGAVNNLNCTHNLIDKVGYIGFFFDAESNTTSGNVFSNNTVDKSMLNPATAIQLAVGIRGSISTPTDITRGWTINADTLKMPSHTTAATECIELRYASNCTISNLICTGATLGISDIESTRITISHNHCTGQSQYGIEIGNNQFSHTLANVMDGISGTGLIVDGLSHTDTLNNDTIRNTTLKAMLLNTGVHDILISGCYITHATQGIYCQNTDSITIYHTRIDGGSHAGTTGVFVNGGRGNISIQRGGIVHNTYAVYANNSTPGQVVNNIIGVSVSLTGTSVQFGNSFTNGAHYGPQVYFVSGALVFSPIGSKVYGVSPFSPGATSLLPITYVTTGHHTSIVSGLVHISGAGIDTITASNGDTSAVQRVTVTKATLTISANSMSKVHGQVNPTLTASYSGLQYGESSSALIALPTLSTTALTGSPLGNYPITATGAVSNNYSFIYVDGVLVVRATGDVTVLHLHVVY